MHWLLDFAVSLVAAGGIGLFLEYLRVRRRLQQLESESRAIDLYFEEKDPNGWAAAKDRAHLLTRRG